MPKCYFCCKECEGKIKANGLSYSICDECKPHYEQAENIGLSPEDVLDAFSYLDDLRDSGVTNMFASGEYISEDWGPSSGIYLSAKDGNKISSFWMTTFSNRAKC